MSAFILPFEGFVQLASELAVHAESNSSQFYYCVRDFLGIHLGDTKFDHHATASLKAQELYEANVKAVNHRYSDCEQAIQPQYFRRMACWSPVQLFKHLQCLRYQMSEGDVPESPIYKALDQLIASVAEVIIGSMSAYDAAKWSWPEKEPDSGTVMRIC